MGVQRFAVNLADLTELKQRDPLICDILFGPILTRDLRSMDKERVDGTVLLLADSVSLDRWQAICQVLVMGLAKYRPRLLLRLYQTNENGKAWHSIGNTMRLRA